jgi:DNA-binding FrmR family transcriptional regulator
MVKKVTKKVVSNPKLAVSKLANKMASCHEPKILTTGFPDHSKEQKRLGRIKGQIDGVDRMIVEGRYCLDIIYQIRAAASALKALEKEVMVTHIKSCVTKAIESKNPHESQEKIEEIMNFF